MIESDYKWPLNNFIEKWANFCAKMCDDTKVELSEVNYKASLGELAEVACQWSPGIIWAVQTKFAMAL